jgi:hypothetical protein
MSLENYTTKHLLSIAFFLISVGTSFAEPIIEKKVSHSILNPVDSSLVLALDQSNGNKILKVSFNGNEGNEGSIVIKLNSNIVKSAQFELIKSPYSASVDISNLASGTYEVVLTTAQGVHSAQLIIA